MNNQISNKKVSKTKINLLRSILWQSWKQANININIDQEKTSKIIIWAFWKEPEPLSKWKHIQSCSMAPRLCVVIWIFSKKRRRKGERVIYYEKDHHFKVRKTVFTQHIFQGAVIAITPALPCIDIESARLPCHFTLSQR